MVLAWRIELQPQPSEGYARPSRRARIGSRIGIRTRTTRLKGASPAVSVCGHLKMEPAPGIEPGSAVYRTATAPCGADMVQPRGVEPRSVALQATATTELAQAAKWSRTSESNRVLRSTRALGLRNLSGANAF